ncbi:PaaI family thioesterase [Pseudomonas sp. BGr12]|uniref:PaaI family thioesterase n=1 Tax=unclassified Pseudomonas TaxID=196821 RepID=UPI00177C3124|nr:MULTISPECIES: PaaI family thioesterase [unclassified Pseudomonas]MBD9500603.1 PaaI family thioesterase [Pseudomonas sp. PDM17]MBD9577713.1 PaaI family thioesterase [Pseudomonas sp. PDM23]MBD9672273.1 PaaI family thioesterase [Pseudomonas sp. PDM21]MDL2430781.1 PaaI family thioesterase [Pseudomonas sp. BJa5]
MAAVDLSQAAIPAGFSPLPTPPGFARHCGGFYLHDELPVLAVRIGEHLLNSVRIVHGGFLATLADSAFGVVFRRAYDLEFPPITVNLSLDYLGAVREGDWLEAHVEILKFGGSFANADCRLKVGERTVLRATGIFTLWKGSTAGAR